MNGDAWHPTIVRRFIESYPTSTNVARVDTDAGEGFLKPMGNPEGPHVLACELVGTMLAQWDVLVREMRERGWSYKFEHNVAGKYSAPTMIMDPKAVFEGDREPFTAVGIDPDKFRAIAIAAAKALGVFVE